MLDQGLAGAGEPHSPGVSLHQRAPGLALQRRDLLRDGRLGVAQGLAGGGGGTMLRDLSEHAQTLHIEHKRTLSHPRQNVICSYLTRVAS